MIIRIVYSEREYKFGSFYLILFLVTNQFDERLLILLQPLRLSIQMVYRLILLFLYIRFLFFKKYF